MGGSRESSAESPVERSTHAPRPDTHRRAAIDIGTNSVKLLVADVGAGAVEPVFETSEQTRLGRGFFPGRRLQPDAIRSTARTVAEFTAKAKQLGAPSIRALATSAARDAVNGAELAATILTASGLTIEIISGEQEAELAFRGAMTLSGLAGRPFLLLDVGGGSTEFIVSDGNQVRFRQSFELGTVRLLESFKPADPPTPKDWFRCSGVLRSFLSTEIGEALTPPLKDLPRESLLLVSTGGTATILARMEKRMEGYDRAQIEATLLSLAQVRAHRYRLWCLPLAERCRIIGLPAERADVILFGVAIIEAVMDQFSFSQLQVSTRGIRFGALL
jgi:exopolyphosphatase/guanosine-5'-triphosphate,3'-diphosphate pyrophosphatase